MVARGGSALDAADRYAMDIMTFIQDKVGIRILFIFLPTLMNGDWKRMGLYAPFMFSYVLGALRKEIMTTTAQGFNVMCVIHPIPFRPFAHRPQCSIRAYT